MLGCLYPLQRVPKNVQAKQYSAGRDIGKCAVYFYMHNNSYSYRMLLVNSVILFKQFYLEYEIYKCQLNLIDINIYIIIK